MDKQTQTFSISPPINLVEEGKWLLAVTSFEANNCVFKITYENNSFSIRIPGRWRIPNYLEDGIIDKLENLLNLRSQNDIKLQVEEVRERGNKIKLRDKQKNKLTDFDTSKNELLVELKTAHYHDLEDLDECNYHMLKIWTF